jgi:hypothetical protein
LVSAVQGGQSRSLVLRGWAEIWKRAVLAYLVESGVEQSDRGGG